MGTTIRKYCEPMVGAGAVLFDILNTYAMDEIYICDTNVELINTYRVIQENVNSLIGLLIKYEKEHLKRNDAERKEYYYQQRERFNAEIKKSVSNSLKNTLPYYGVTKKNVENSKEYSMRIFHLPLNY